jgi:GTP cyclohydrolase II
MPLTGFKQIAEVTLPTRWASFSLLALDAVHVDRTSKQTRLETALVLGDLHTSPLVVRIHSQCTTGDAFEDCHDQLHLAMHSIVSPIDDQQSRQDPQTRAARCGSLP